MTHAAILERVSEIGAVLEAKGYDIIRPLGSGRYAQTFQLKSHHYPESFCAKVIDAVASGQADAHGVVDTEFRSLVSLIHPNIITIFDFFESDDLLYLVLEFAEGGSLADKLLLLGAFPSAEFTAIARQTIEALAYCHSEGIVHGDIKPANILLDRYGRPKVADFGLAARYEPGENPKHCGSPSYMAPELLCGRARDPFACDVWALGVTFYELVIGRRPFTSESCQELLREIACAYIKFPTTVPTKISHMISLMLSFDPRLRPKMSRLLEAPLFTTQRQRLKAHSTKNVFYFPGTHQRPGGRARSFADQEVNWVQNTMFRAPEHLSNSR
jgi:serine/threonine protein kinase